MSADGTRLATYAWQTRQVKPRMGVGKIRLWDTNTAAEIAACDTSDLYSRSLTLSRDGRLCSATTSPVSSPSQLVVYDIAAGTEVFRRDASTLQDSWLSDDGKRLFSWDTTTNNFAVSTLQDADWKEFSAGAKGLFGCGTFSSATGLFATTKALKLAAAGQTRISTPLEVYEPESGGRVFSTEDAQNAASLAFSHDGGMLLAMFGDGQISLWNTNDWKYRKFSPRSPALPAPPAIGMNSHILCLSPDGSWLVTAFLVQPKGSPATSFAEVWDVAKGERRCIVDTGRRVPLALALPNERMVFFREGQPLEWREARTGAVLK